LDWYFSSQGGDLVLSPIAQAYLEIIYNITVEGDAVVNARLAEKFGVSRPNVTWMLHRLERDRYLVRAQLTGLQLTELGTAVAEASLRRHRLAERFLFDVLHMDWVMCHEEAHVLQSALSPAIEAHLVAVLANPTTCPHGNPIPGSAPRTDNYLRAHQAFRLSGAVVDTHLRVLCISGVLEDETSLLRSIDSMGIRPGVDVVVHAIRPVEKGLLEVELAGQRHPFNQATAEKIWVHLPALTQASELS
jgi:DtxR family transcriptional regulator, Mn-dependent transcriptional regulator